MIVLTRQILAMTVLSLIITTLAFSQVSEAPPKTTEQKPPPPEPSTADNRTLIHFGDLVNVDVVGSAEFDWRGEITSDGFLGGLAFTDDPVYALCRETSDVAGEIQNSYGKFLNNPVVTVEILDRSKRPLATLFGSVRQPQRFNLMRPVSLKELIILSGGFSENAAGIIEIVSRPYASCDKSVSTVLAGVVPVADVKGTASTTYVKINIKDILAGVENPTVRYGDIITVLSAEPVYVIGNVAKPGPVSISDGLTVARAISAAGGISGKEEKAGIRLFRRNPTGSEVIELTSGSQSSVNPDEFVVNGYDIIQVFGSGNDGIKYPPVLRNQEFESQRIDELPIRIID